MAEELEIKLTLDSRQIDAAVNWLLSRDGVSDQGSKALVNRYYDTANGELNRRKIALRVRQKGDRFIQTLKTQGEFVDGAHRRQEWEWELPGPDLKLGLLADTLVGEGLNLAELAPVFETNFERRVLMIEAGDSAIEVAVDRGQVIAGDIWAPLDEVEFELKAGEPAALMDWASQMAAQVPVFLNLVSKAEQGYYLAGLYEPGMPPQDGRWEPLQLLEVLSKAWLTGKPLQVAGSCLEAIRGAASDKGMTDACQWLCEELGRGTEVRKLISRPELGQLQLALAVS